MVPVDFSSYFATMAGADAALLGLLFVAVSINPDHIFSSGGSPERQAVAVNAFAALISAFFISTTGLLPGANIGGTGVFMAGIGVFTSTRLGVQIAQYHLRSKRHPQPLWLRLFRSLVTVAGSLVLYGYLFATSVRLLVQPRSGPAVTTMAALVLVCCGLGIVRAWELLGAPRVGVLAGWLNPFQASPEEPVPAVTYADSSRTGTPDLSTTSTAVADNAAP